MARPYKDWSGTRKGFLVVSERVGTKGTAPLWRCKCDCGNIVDIPSPQLYGATISCGCVRRSRLSDGMQKSHGYAGKNGKRTRIYNIWNGMKSRCLYPSQPHYERYGGRGITVCKRWMTFENFLTDMGEPPEGHTLDRIDNDGPYAPWNCRWSSVKDQSNNTRKNLKPLEYQGQTKTMQEWSDELGLKYNTIYMRLRKGWPIEKALSTAAH